MRVRVRVRVEVRVRIDIGKDNSPLHDPPAKTLAMRR